METLDEKNSGGMSEKAFYDITGTASWLKITAIVAMSLMGLMVLLLLWALTKGAGSDVLIPLLIYIAMIAFYFLLLKQGNALSSFATSRNSADLEEFGKNFKIWWTVVGVLSIISAVIFLIAILFVGGNLMRF